MAAGLGTITAVSAGNGTTSISYTGEIENRWYTLTATPNEGYVFKKWVVSGSNSGGLVGGRSYSEGDEITSNPIEVQEGNGADTTFTAYFALQTPTYKAERLYRDSKIQETKTVTENGTVAPDSGYEAMKEVVVNVPTSTIEEETRTVPLNMYSGNMVITPNEGKLFSRVTITKPDTMLPENIKKDVTIGGVTGTLDGSALTAETDSEMEALMTAENSGDMVKFTGTSSNTYVMDCYYQIKPEAYSISYNLSYVTGNSGNPTKINSGEIKTIAFTVSDSNYSLPDYIEVTGATIQSWNSSTGVLMLAYPTSNVTIKVTGESAT